MGKIRDFINNWQYRFLALGLAFLAWYLVSGREKVEIWVDVPLEIINLPPNYLITNGGMLNKIQVRIRGTKALLERVEEKKISYTLDLSDVRKGSNVLVLSPKNLTFPGPLEVVEVIPSRLELVIDELVVKEVPVVVKWEGKVSRYFELTSVQARPKIITIKGPSTLLENIKDIKTKLIEIKDRQPESLTWVEKIGLDLLPEIEAEVGEVQVEFKLAPKTRELWVRRPVELKKPQDLTVVSDQKFVRLKLALPLYLLKREGWRDMIQVRLEVKKNIQPGNYNLDYQVILPPYTQLLEKRPERIAVQVK
jgi:YbbR domain-containing protein